MTAQKPLPDSVHLDETVQLGPQVIFVEGAETRVADRVVIGQGVRIGSGTYLRAGSVVLKDIPANAVMEGNQPRSRATARRIRPLVAKQHSMGCNCTIFLCAECSDA